MRSARVRALIVAVPLLAALALAANALFERGGGSAPRAFAEAGPGSYAVAIRNEGTEDTLIAVDAASGDVSEVARVAHLDGYTSYGAVSPAGRQAALVVADEGTPSRPVASLHIVDLDSSVTARVLTGIDQLQQPIWAPDSSAVFVTRTAVSESAATTVEILRVTPAGGATVAMTLPGVAGAYPVGFDGAGRLLAVAVTEAGSMLYRESGEPMLISDVITRDWRVSPDGSEIAFIEARTEDGLRYVFNSARLDGDTASRAQAASQPGQQLGVAWAPSGEIAVGQEPGSGATRDIVAAGSATGGFDIPIEFAPDGGWLAVEAWTGTSFAIPGSVELQVVNSSGRTPLPGAQRFAGWTVR